MATKEARIVLLRDGHVGLHDADPQRFGRVTASADVGEARRAVRERRDEESDAEESEEGPSTRGARRLRIQLGPESSAEREAPAEERRVEEGLPREVRRLNPRQERDHPDRGMPGKELPYERKREGEREREAEDEADAPVAHPERGRARQREGEGLTDPEQSRDQEGEGERELHEGLKQPDDPIEGERVADRPGEEPDPESAL